MLAGLVFTAPIVWDLVAGSDEPTSTPPTEAAAPTTTLPVTTVAQPEPTVTEPVPAPVVDSIFGSEVGAFVERWNEVAGEVSPALRFRAFVPAGDFESGFTEWIALLGSVSANGALDRVTLEIDPAGPGASDQLGIQALGVLIAVVDPSLEPGERAALLAEMGLDVRNPELGGIDGTVEFNGNEYRLRFDDEAVRLFLTVSPA